MAKIALADFNTITDGISGQAGELNTALTNMKTFDTANTDAYDGADKVLTVALGLGDYEQETSLVTPSNSVVNKVGSPNVYYRVTYDPIISALERHTGGIDQYLKDNAETVSQTFADVCAACGVSISSANIA